MAREYKDSSIEWIGQIPKEWEVELIGNNIKEINNKNDDSSEDNALQFKMGTIISKKGGDSKYNPESLAAYTKVKEGDIVINGLNLSFDFISQRVGLVREKGVITSTYLTLRPSSLLHSEFVNYLFKAYDNCKAFHGMGRGLRQILAYRELKNQKLIYPSLAEQQKIADYLDKVCGEVDEMIALQEQMIEELKAYKQSVITEAVTKGLNPDIPMKDSGIDWIGEVPEGWDISRIGMFYFVTKLAGFEYTDTLMNKISPEGDVPIVRAQNVRMFNFNKESISEFVDSETSLLLDRCSLDKRALLMTFIGAGIGDVCIIDEPQRYHLAPNVAKMEIIEKYESMIYDKYIMYFLGSNAGKGEISKISKASAQASLSMSTIRKISITIPPLSEQQSIASYLDTKCAEIDALIAIKQAKIEELKEYKKSIIYEYVTGKKEVV